MHETRTRLPASAWAVNAQMRKILPSRYLNLYIRLRIEKLKTTNDADLFVPNAFGPNWTYSVPATAIAGDTSSSAEENKQNTAREIKNACICFNSVKNSRLYVQLNAEGRIRQGAVEMLNYYCMSNECWPCELSKRSTARVSHVPQAPNCSCSNNCRRLDVV